MENNNKSEQLPARSPAQLLSKSFGKGNSYRQIECMDGHLAKSRVGAVEKRFVLESLLVLEIKMKNNYTVEPRYNYEMIGIGHINDNKYILKN